MVNQEIPVLNKIQTSVAIIRQNQAYQLFGVNQSFMVLLRKCVQVDTWTTYSCN